MKAPTSLRGAKVTIAALNKRLEAAEKLMAEAEEHQEAAERWFKAYRWQTERAEKAEARADGANALVASLEQQLQEAQRDRQRALDGSNRLKGFVEGFMATQFPAPPKLPWDRPGQPR